MQKLIIVESPTKSRTIAQFLGKEYKVKSSFGHIRDLPQSKLGVDTERDFTPQYVIPTKARKTVNALKKEVQKADATILATDEDREGEAIAWHLAETLQLKNPQRIVFHEITKSAIEDALKNPREIDMNRVDAQQARRILDRLVGYKLSPFLWKKVARKLSAGRVQSVAVRLVVERENEIRNFKTQEYWTIAAKLLKLTPSYGGVPSRMTGQIQNEFIALLVQKDGKAIDKLDIKSNQEAESIKRDLEGAEYVVAHIEKKEVKRNPLPPFSTSTLQQAAWQRLHFPARLTMQLAQQLYETGHITYHRTDSLNLSVQSLSAAKNYITQTFGSSYWPGFSRQFKTKSKGAQEAHEAIRPTYANRTPQTTRLEKNQLKLYDLIWRRFIASQMSQAVFDSTTVEIKTEFPNKSQISNDKKPIYTFQTTGQMLKFDGFLKIYPMKFTEADLPLLQIQEVLELKELIVSQHFTQPPPRYNEATLVKALETHGIGRPSTYAPILSTIQERNYIEKDEQKRFRPTEIGELVNKILVEHFPAIVDISFTAGMEQSLDEIAENKEEWVPTIRRFYIPFAETLEQKYKEVRAQRIATEVTDKKCPECGSPVVIRFGKYGKFYACSTFPTCKYTASLEQENFPKISCPRCKEGFVVPKHTKRKKLFYGCNRYPACDFALWDKPTGEICKTCNALLVETTRKRVKCSNSSCTTNKK